MVRSGWSRATLRVLLAAAPGQPVSAMLVALDPGQSGKSPRTQPGRVFAFCVSGSVVLETPAEKFELARGDGHLVRRFDAGGALAERRYQGRRGLIVSLPE